ncbi:MAG TPA: type I glutamate--ammonia ligase [Bacillota bacterium]|nr:type I glutamate--ammonia ligase [Bacillota bacterium]HPZ65084.1 type I glutamate--ammonia ligase [Bacillota bacterium]HQD06299.1 type I glutamate--ammonia ligase [Bacillota bacterium]
MFNSYEELKKYCTDKGIRFIDFKIIDLVGRWHHLTVPLEGLTEEILEQGIGIDGSSYGFLSVEKSDMVFKPDLTTAFMDHFARYPMLSVISDIYSLEEEGAARFEGDPRYVAQKAERYLQQSGVADSCILWPEFEFYVLDHISYQVKPQHVEVLMDSEQAAWNTADREYGNLGYKVRSHGGYHADLPYDSSFDLRNEIVTRLQESGVPVKYHHSENGGPGQGEIELGFGPLTRMADRSMMVKYFVKNTAMANGRTVTFMPKPFYDEAGSGMHVHIQFFRGGKPVFYDPQGYSGLSRIALQAIGGVLQHARALAAFTNPSTNSYKRLVPGYEAPVNIGFATSNRSAVIRIPGYALSPEAKRFEYRPMDATCNPYLAYAAILMAAIDGIEQQIDPTAAGFGPFDFNLYTLSEEEKGKIKSLPRSLEEAADALEQDYGFLTRSGVFPENLIRDQLFRLRREAEQVNTFPHPLEYEMYYDL